MQSFSPDPRVRSEPVHVWYGVPCPREYNEGAYQRVRFAEVAH